MLRSLLGGAEYGAAGGSAQAMAAVVKGAENAARWQAGAEGEKLTALWLRPLTHFGWVLLNDRKLPGDRVNFDHILLGHGVFSIDSKMWKRTDVKLRRGVLYREEIEQDLSTTAQEAQIVSSRLGTRVDAICCVHGPKLPLAGYRVRTTYGAHVLVVNPSGMLWHLLRAPRRLDRERIASLTKRAMQAFPGYSAATAPWWWS